MNKLIPRRENIDKDIKVSYDETKGNDVFVYAKSFRIKSDFCYPSEDRGFRRAVCSKGKEALQQSEIIVIVKNGALEKEIRINGFIRVIKIGDWE